MLREGLRSRARVAHSDATAPQWIDLVFGHKQRGAAAEKSDNLFHHLTYDDLGHAACAERLRV